MRTQRVRRPGAGSGPRLPFRSILALMAAVTWLLVPPADATTLEEMFRSRSQKADYVIVVDRSGSMAAFWEVVMNGTADFVSALPEGDHVSIALFGRDSTSTAILPRTIDRTSRANLERELRSFPRPTGRGNKACTDLGAAMAGAVDEIRRPGAHPRRAVEEGGGG